MVELGFTLSPFVIFKVFWFYVYKEKYVSAGYGMLAYEDFLFVLLAPFHLLMQISSNSDEI